MVVVIDVVAGEVFKKLLMQLAVMSKKTYMCKTKAKHLKIKAEEFLRTIDEINNIGLELLPHRRAEIDNFLLVLTSGKNLAENIISSGGRNPYRLLRFALKMKKVEKRVSEFVGGTLTTHILADVHHLRSDFAAGIDQVHRGVENLAKQIASMNIGRGGFVGEAVGMEMSGDFGNLGVGFELGKRKVKEMMFKDNGGVIGITGMGGSGKTTLALEIQRDEDVRRYFDNHILYLTVSKSPDLEELRSQIWKFLYQCRAISSSNLPEWNSRLEQGVETQALVILDDVWKIDVVDRLRFGIRGYKTLIVSRSKLVDTGVTYHMELLKGEAAMSLFCLCAFEQESVLPGVDENLVKKIVRECRGLPLALKVIGASLKGQPEKYWEGALERLSRGKPINETHESRVLQQIATSLDNLSHEHRECFLDLAAFPEDRKIPVDVLIKMWVEVYGLEEEDAFAILVDLSEKNLLTLVRDLRFGDSYTSYHDVFVTQHDVLRDVALHLSNNGKVNERQRLLMPKRRAKLPAEWERNSDHPYSAQIVSIHIGEMNEVDWFGMELPKAEVLILNFSSDKLFLPPFIGKMRRLRVLVIVNNSMSPAFLLDSSFFSDLNNLRSLWLERVHFPVLSETMVPLDNLQKLSLILCKVHTCFSQSAVDIAHIFPSLNDLTISHSDDLVELPANICGMTSLKSLNITNCHRLRKLPKNLGKLQALEHLRLYNCVELENLPAETCELPCLKHLDISECLSLVSLPEEIGNLKSLEKIDMRECCSISGLPGAAASLESLHRVVCDKEIAWMWEDIKNVVLHLHVETAEKFFSLAWLDD